LGTVFVLQKIKVLSKATKSTHQTFIPKTPPSSVSVAKKKRAQRKVPSALHF